MLSPFFMGWFYGLTLWAGVIAMVADGFVAFDESLSRLEMGR
ncbi:MAG: hypothetical protein ACFCBU_03605 [Cyanophyceae cyanobacterium]